jgi:hypothetical protein
VVGDATDGQDGDELDARDETGVGTLAALEAVRKGKPRLEFRLPVGRSSASSVRPALAELIADADPVVIEQIAVLVGALTSGGGRVEASAAVEVEVWTESTRIAVMLRDSEFARHRSEAGFVELDRSMVSGWRLRLVERLADRWSVVNEDGLTMRFEFDRDRRGAANGVDAVANPPVVASSAPSGPPVGGSRFIPGKRRSGDGRGVDAPPRSLDVDQY